ncbi:MAG: tRNA (N6-isopentenyl adenosine(37)-C2)-methylthiotransferase MiaB [Oscillospiraceae bacterium]|nr:tRNA (N6-isopentenyl adenosine(37)-C2)-methylthiotransferase MiaB [Oscillospiraceae bacterium]MDD7278140.1 tRNA (N6-isopentenyl adenosine(37)-C2)-methylthiotransferase MiaB [Oscillospiraceae bacterium]MDY2864845.1 tRNA (N6-isopentenyl adenosine(37)-C2)-methylthiotransferase MiaB [Oscillospiraceae bacterium]
MEINYIEEVRKIFSEREAPPLCCVHSYGCQQNVSDGEKLLGQLSLMGCGVTDDMTAADIIILNTCAVRENAELKVYGNIGELKRLKEQKPDMIIAVGGCMGQEPKTAEKIKKSYRHVDIVFGTFAAKELPRLIYEALTQRRLIVDTAERNTECFEDIPAVRNEKYKAGVSIMYGCNNFCSYCIVPYVRGRERSREPEKIIEEIKRLANSGCKEIMLLGQNVNSYGRGLDEKIDFPELLRRIDSIDGDFRVRFMSPHPKDATNEFFDVIAESKKICRSVHLPLQSGSDRILKEMNRRYTVQKYMDMVSYARKVMPELSISTDIIVGFPNETYDDFLQTLDVVKAVKYDNIFSFIYSKRTGTKAADIIDHTSEEDKGKWFRELLAVQREISEEHYKRFMGAEFDVLFDGTYKEEFISGKSGEFIITLVKGTPDLIGTMRKVRVTKTHNWAVEGELI